MKRVQGSQFGEQCDENPLVVPEYDELARTMSSGFHMNPSQGNIKDGLITDAIKSTRFQDIALKRASEEVTPKAILLAGDDFI